MQRKLLFDNGSLAGQSPLAMFPVNVVLPYVKEGKLAVIAVLGKGRSLLAPEAQSFDELGLKSLDIDIHYLISGPAKLSPEISGQLNSEIAGALTDVSEQSFSLLPNGVTPDVLAALIEADVARWKVFIMKAGITVE